MATVVEQAQEYVAARPVDAWLVYEYQGMNPTFEALTAEALAKPAHNATRPMFAFVPPSGQPMLLAHAVDVGRFLLHRQSGWEVRRYTGHRELH